MGYSHSYLQLKQINAINLLFFYCLLTHLSLASFLWDTERGVPSGAILFAYRIFIEQTLKITPDAPKNESGLTRMIMMGKFIRQIWVNVSR